MQNFRRHEENGFTLIEVLVAMAILAVALAAILSAMTTGLRSASRAADATEATELAQSLLAQQEVSLPPEYGETNGSTADGDHWRVAVQPWAPNDEPQQIGAYRVVISVTRNGYTASFSTLLTGPVANAP